MIYELGDRHPDLQGDGHFIAPSASIIGTVTLKQGASIWFNAVLWGDNDLIEIGANSKIQDGCDGCSRTGSSGTRIPESRRRYLRAKQPAIC